MIVIVCLNGSLSLSLSVDLSKGEAVEENNDLEQARREEESWEEGDVKEISK